MIVKMSKIEVIGPRDLLVAVLGTLQRSEVLQIDSEIKKSLEAGAEARLRPLVLDGQTLAERLFLEDLKVKIDRLLTLLPKVQLRETYLSPSRAISSIASLISKHIEACEERSRRRQALQAELGEINRYLLFLTTVESLAPKGATAAGLDVIAVEVRDPAAFEQLKKVAGRLLLGTEVQTARTDDGSYIGLLTTEKELSEQLKESLRDNQIPEVSLPSYLEGLSLPDKIETAKARYDELATTTSAIDEELATFARSWRSIYEAVRKWLDEKLSLLKASTSLYETDNCFVLFGWMPSAELPKLRSTLAESYQDTVVVEEKEILKQDLEKVPVALRNRPYFQPFELLVRLLPLPRYGSFDPTPFIGIFFPLFFGMILGDVGYGVVLLLIALGLIYLVRHRRIVQQVGRILLIASLYTVIFGFLYGEFFGEFGVEVLGLPHGYVDRRTSIMPMLYFAISVGAVHVVVGLVLGFLSAMKGERTREAVSRLFSIVIVLCLLGILASFFAPVAALLRKPLIIASLIVAPILLVAGGLLAPLELLRHLGNIVSYARIMAVGLTSVLLAYVANNLAGAAGSIWVGAAVAILLHTFNIVLGLFAPTLHALRLHYVEFFSKFVEPGGRQFKPFKRT